jgi:hypothetical protein
MDRRARNCPSLIIGAICLTLNNDFFSLLKQSQENINVNAIVGQMANIDLGSRCLCAAIPKQISIAGVARCGTRVSFIKE